VIAVSIDGRLVDEAAARISVLDRGFLRGDSVFEVLRVYGDGAFGLRAHLERLARSAAAVLIRMPVSIARLEDECREVVAAYRASASGDAQLRITLTRGTAAGLDVDPEGEPLRVISVAPLSPLPPQMYAGGVGVALEADPVVVPGRAGAGAKYGRYLPNLLARFRARARGAEEALLSGPDGRVVEGATSNVFLVRGGALVTPPESAGILAGITRAWILDEARRMGMPVEEAPLPAEALLSAEEAFLTSSLRELVPIRSVDGTPRAVGAMPVCRRLHAALRAAAGARGPQPWEG
jgi:branched-chain amino acid aminotransferase